jgi:hypothetical protein
MTAYVAASTLDWSGGTVLFFAVRAGTYEIKISRIEYGIPGISGGSQPTAAIRPTIYRYTTGTISGGSAITPAPLSQGAPAATSTAAMGQSMTISGAITRFTDLPAQSISSGATTVSSVGGFGTYTPAFDCTISPGSVFVLQMGWSLSGGGTATAVAGVYFEELRLAWHY